MSRWCRTDAGQQGDSIPTPSIELPDDVAPLLVQPLPRAAGKPKAFHHPGAFVPSDYPLSPDLPVPDHSVDCAAGGGLPFEMLDAIKHAAYLLEEVGSVFQRRSGSTRDG
jgi:hypothetical protein